MRFNEIQYSGCAAGSAFFLLISLFWTYLGVIRSFLLQKNYCGSSLQWKRFDPHWKIRLICIKFKYY